MKIYKITEASEYLGVSINNVGASLFEVCPWPSQRIVVEEKYWDCPEDVPGPVCWIRHNGDSLQERLVCKVTTKGVTAFNSDFNGFPISEHVEYSTDRINWSKCLKK